MNTWKVWSTLHPHLIDLSDPASPPTTPEGPERMAFSPMLPAMVRP